MRVATPLSPRAIVHSSDYGVIYTTNKAMLGKDVGGIDMNPNKLDIQTQGQTRDFNIPFDPQTIQGIPIDGFAPVIFQIIPTNLNMLMHQ